MQEFVQRMFAAARSKTLGILRSIMKAQEGFDIPEVQGLRADVEPPTAHPVNRDTHDAPARFLRHDTPHAPTRRAR